MLASHIHGGARSPSSGSLGRYLVSSLWVSSPLYVLDMVRHRELHATVFICNHSFLGLLQGRATDCMSSASKDAARWPAATRHPPPCLRRISQGFEDIRGRRADSPHKLVRFWSTATAPSCSPLCRPGVITHQHCGFIGNTSAYSLFFTPFPPLICTNGPFHSKKYKLARMIAENLPFNES